MTCKLGDDNWNANDDDGDINHNNISKYFNTWKQLCVWCIYVFSVIAFCNILVGPSSVTVVCFSCKYKEYYLSVLVLILYYSYITRKTKYKGRILLMNPLSKKLHERRWVNNVDYLLSWVSKIQKTSSIGLETWQFVFWPLTL